MLVQSSDGNVYRNPRFEGDRWILQINDDGAVLHYKGKVVWSTARRSLPRAGVKAQLDTALLDGTLVMGDALVKASRFKLLILKPIPTPTHHEGVIRDISFEVSDLEGEKVLTWKKSKGKSGN